MSFNKTGKATTLGVIELPKPPKTNDVEPKESDKDKKNKKED